MADSSPDEWKKRAEEVREEARKLTDPVLQREMEAIARAYERLARHAVKRKLSKPDK